MTDKNGGAACARCYEPAVRYQGHQHLCAKHYRFGQMRAGAKRNGKIVPSHQHLENMVSLENRCLDCNSKMNWLAIENQVLVATLQHYRDGSLGLVCRSCNTRHAYMPDDTFRKIGVDEKLCPKCKIVKKVSSFCKDNSRSGIRKLKSYCRDCSRDAHIIWRSKKPA